ncbi:MAG: sialate O-acetylesterase, partial [Pseudomonadota bacterium]
EGVYIYAGHPGANNGEAGGGLGYWTTLTPGFGIGFASDGETNSLSNRFGIELPFAARLHQKAPEKNIAIIKASRGGTSLALGASGYGDWSLDYSEGNRRNSYDNALTAISGAMTNRDIDGDGAMDVLTPRGILWMQGESDAAHTAETAAAYEENLTRMMNLLRAALWTDELPVVIGQIKDSGDTPETRVMPYSPEVIAIQNEYAASHKCATIVKVTEGFEFPEDDPWHYLSENYLELGEAFADAVLALETSCPPGD